MHHRQWLATVLTMASVAVAGLLVPPPRTTHAEPPVPIHLIQVAGSWSLTAASDNGRFVVMAGQVIDTHTHEAHTLGYSHFGVRVDNSGTVYDVRDGRLWSDPLDGTPAEVPVELPSGFDLFGVVAVQASGERALVSGRSGLESGVFVIELASGALIASRDSLRTGSLRGSTTWFHDDGSIVAAQFEVVGQAGMSSYAVWAPDLSSVTKLDPPAEHDRSDGPFFVDHSLEYMWFATDEGGVVDSVAAGPARMYRRHIESGATVVAPAETLDAARIEPLPSGGLILTVDLPPGETLNRQLFRWDGSSDTVEQLTVGFDGSEPNGAVMEYLAPTGADVITVTSRASNLAPAIPHEPWSGHLYQITAEPRPEPPAPPPYPEPPSVPLTEAQAATRPAAPVGPGETYCVPAVGARPGEFVGANITPVGAVRNGNGALHASDDDPPSTANVNYRSGSVDPNVAFAQVGPDRSVCFTNSHHGPVDVVIDALVVVDGDAFRLPSEDGAVRIADTRSGLGGEGLAPAETRCVEAVGASAGEFTGVNITPVGAAARGNGALHSSDDQPPSTANVNFASGSVDPNLAFARVGADGRVCFTNSRHGPVDVVMDLLLVATPDVFRLPTEQGAVRVVDTRSGVGPGRFAPGETQCFAGIGAEPGEWVGLNLTPVGATTNGNGAAHSSDDDPPATANVNFRAGSVDPNLALLAVGSSGDVCFSNSDHGPVDLVVDELFVARSGVFRPPTPEGAYRLTDTRTARHGETLAPPEIDGPPTLVHIEQAADLGLIDASDDGRYVVLGDPSFATGLVIDMATSASFDLEHQPNRLSKIDEAGTVYTTEAGAITVEELGAAPSEVPSSLPDPWAANEVVDVDLERRRALVRAGRDAGFTFGLFLVDLDSGTTPNGSEPLPGSTSDSSRGWFRSDGSFVTGGVGVHGVTGFLVWNVAGSASTAIDRPAEASWGPWSIDPTASYVWFVSDVGGLVPGVEAGTRRLYRRTTATGTTVVAPEPAVGANRIFPLADGSILVTTNDPLAPDDPVGLNIWDGVADSLVRLDVRIDGSDPNAWPFSIHPPHAGGVLTFTTDATDLGPKLLRSGRYLEGYQIDLDDEEPSR